MKGIEEAFTKILEADGVVFLPLTIILVGIIVYFAWKLNVYYRNELHDERESSKQDRRDFLTTLSELKNSFRNMSSDMKRIEDKVNEIEKEVRK